MIILSHKRQDTIVMMIPCLCSFRSSSCDLRHKKIPRPNGLAASFLVDIPTRWEPRTNQSNGLRLLIFPQPLVRALKNQNAAPTTPPCFCRRQRSSSLHWGFDCLRCARHVLFSSCTAHHKKSPDRMVWGCGGAFSTALEPKTSSRVTVLASSVKLKLSTTRSSKT